MPMCGFNQKMLEGMNNFHKGLVKAIVNKEFLTLEGKEKRKSKTWRR